jgi:hypothetical protein
MFFELGFDFPLISIEYLYTLRYAAQRELKLWDWIFLWTRSLNRFNSLIWGPTHFPNSKILWYCLFRLFLLCEDWDNFLLRYIFESFFVCYRIDFFFSVSVHVSTLHRKFCFYVLYTTASRKTNMHCTMLLVFLHKSCIRLAMEKQEHFRMERACLCLINLSEFVSITILHSKEE